MKNRKIILDAELLQEDFSLIVPQIKKAFKGLTISTGLPTPHIRKIAAESFKELPSHEKDKVFAWCECLLKEAKWEYGIVAFDWAYRVREQYDDRTFFLFESWLKNYVRGWVDVDDFCTHAFGYLIYLRKGYFVNVLLWTKSESFWVRRAAAVVFIYAIKKGKVDEKDLFKIADGLMRDSHYLVLKGYGWMLKVLSQKKPKEVHRYLMENKTAMPSLSFRYASMKLKQQKEWG